MKVSDAIEILCQRKRFHVIVFTLLALNFMFIPIHIFVDLFLNYEPKHYCSFPKGDSKLRWIPYNHETHYFQSCLIYGEPLTEEEERQEEIALEQEVYHKDVQVWDWKTLKFKSKHHHPTEDDNSAAVGESTHQRRRRRRSPRPGPEPPRPPQVETPDPRVVEEEDLDPHTDPPVGHVNASQAADGGAEVRGGEETSSEVTGDLSPVSELAGHDEADIIVHKFKPEVTEEEYNPVRAGNHDDGDDDDDHVIVHTFDPAEPEHAPEGMQHETEHMVSDGDGQVPSESPHNPDHNQRHSGEHSIDHEGHGDTHTDPSDHSDSRRDHKEHSDTHAAEDDSETESSHSDHDDRVKLQETDRIDDADHASHDDADHVESDHSSHGGPEVHVSHVRDRNALDSSVHSGYDTSHYTYLHRTIPCNHGFHYQNNLGDTLVTMYGLSCDNDKSVITNAIMGIGMVAGAIIFAPFVDKYGRKTLFMMVWCQNCLISFGIAAVADIRSYWVLRFLSRFYIEGVEIALLVLAVEMAPSKSRPIAPLILYVAYAIGQVLLSLQALLFRSWWKLQLAISVETILLIPFSWFLVPESIHWLVSMRRHHDAEKLIRLGCRLNGIILPSDFHLDKADDEEAEGSDEEATGNGYHGKQPRKSAVERLRSKQLNLKNRPGTGEYLQHEFHAHIGEWRKIIDLMKNHQLRRHFFIVSYMWAIVGFLYYGLTVSTMAMKGNVFLNYCLSGLVMIPASVSIFILRRFGRKKPIFYFLIGAGIFIILSVVCPYKTPDGVDLYPVYLAIKLLAKYCVVSCLISIRLLIIELFPTPVRGTLIGLTAFIGLLGSALGYYFLRLVTFSKWVGVVVGALTLLAAGLSRLLPETSHRPLPDTINDMMAACREMFVNLLVALPNMPRPPQQPTTPLSRPKRNVSALSAFSAVLSWKSRSKSGTSVDRPVRSMSDEDFKRGPSHPPLGGRKSAPPSRSGGDPQPDADGTGAPHTSLRSLVQRVREAEGGSSRLSAPVQTASPTLRQKLKRAISQKRAVGRAGDSLDAPPRGRLRRTSSTPSLSLADKQKLGIDNPQYQPDSHHGQHHRVKFDFSRTNSEDPGDRGSIPSSQPESPDSDGSASPDNRRRLSDNSQPDTNVGHRLIRQRPSDNLQADTDL